MSFCYVRTIRFEDTDAAGVVYFANVLKICHEAYEESLAASGINLQLFFGKADVAIPIVRAEVDFFRPMFCGDKIDVRLAGKRLSDEKFEINYQIYHLGQERLSAQAITKHVCIDSSSRIKREIPGEIKQWLEL
jgi:1,4-dihydroxy-2-naphthoyl-CoA hydrolase